MEYVTVFARWRDGCALHAFHPAVAQKRVINCAEPVKIWDVNGK